MGFFYPKRSFFLILTGVFFLEGGIAGSQAQERIHFFHQDSDQIIGDDKSERWGLGISREFTARSSTVNAWKSLDDEGKQSPSPRSFWNEVRLGIADAGECIIAPLTFRSREWLWIAGGLSLTALSFAGDNPVRSFSLQHQSTAAERVLRVGDIYGSPIIPIATTSALFLSGLLLENEWMTTTGRIAFESVVFTGVTVFVMKSVIARSRPVTEKGNWHFNRPSFAFVSDTDAFPSGHTAVAFALSTALSRQLNDAGWSIALYSLAGLTAVNRIYSDRHWFSDTVLGALIGIAFGNLVVDINRKRSEAPLEHLGINMDIGPDGRLYLTIGF